MRVRLTHALLILVILAAAPTAFAAERAQQSDPRFFAETGYPDRQRRVLEVLPGARRHEDVRLADVARDDVQGVHRPVLPARGDADRRERRRDAQPARRGAPAVHDHERVDVPGAGSGADQGDPAPNDPDYNSKIIEFVKENAPDTWEGMPVNFGKTFSTHRQLRRRLPDAATDRPACCRCSTSRSGARRPRSRRAIRRTTISSTSASSAGSCTTTTAASARRACCWATI